MTESDTIDRLLTVPDVAGRLGLNPETVRRWLRSGRITGVRLGGDKAGWRITERDLTKFILEQQGIKEDRNA